MSRIGKKPIALPQGVKVEIKDGWSRCRGRRGRCRGLCSKGFEVGHRGRGAYR